MCGGRTVKHCWDDAGPPNSCNAIVTNAHIVAGAFDFFARTGTAFAPLPVAGVVISACPDACGDASASNQDLVRDTEAQWLQLNFNDAHAGHFVVGPLVGKYPDGGGGPIDGAAEVFLARIPAGGTMHQNLSTYYATSGSIDVTRYDDPVLPVASQRVAGAYDVKFPDGAHVMGAFDVPFCGARCTP